MLVGARCPKAKGRVLTLKNVEPECETCTYHEPGLPPNLFARDITPLVVWCMHPNASRAVSTYLEHKLKELEPTEEDDEAPQMSLW